MTDWAEVGSNIRKRNHASPPDSQSRSVPPNSFGQPKSPISQASAGPVYDDRPHPWRRWFARWIDYMLAAFVLGFVGVFAGTSLLSKNEFVLGFWLSLAQALLIEPLSFALGGGTLGKAILGISVVNEDLSSLDLLQALRRSTNVWLRGMGLALPIVTLFTSIHQYQELTRNGAATYDRDGHYRVRHRELSGGRLALILVFAGIFVLLLILGVTSK